jgi:hypothetical protein
LQRSFELQITGLQASGRLREIEYGRVAQAVLALAGDQHPGAPSAVREGSGSGTGSPSPDADISVNHLLEVCKGLEAAKREAEATKQQLAEARAKVGDRGGVRM